ncbi:MAG: GspH/FimT family pseudopilin [Pontibacterium sp.]
MNRDAGFFSTGTFVPAVRGFTLLELIMTLGIISILLLVALPNLGVWVRESRVQTTANRLQSVLSLARAEAVNRGYRITLCASDTGTRCNSNKRQGKYIWRFALLFQDTDENRLYDSATDELIRHMILSDKVEVLWNRGESTVYQGDGSLLGGSNGSFYVFDAAEPADGLRLVAQMTGRVRRQTLGNTELAYLSEYLDNR